jgi:hypothetical protein
MSKSAKVVLAGEPETHNHGCGVWIPDSHFAASGMTKERCHVAARQCTLDHTFFLVK